ncbi:hypothetical protein CDAR_103981 [Caerostris darwini]|uniref:Uncharacterized protein n=1 Tax=Caerostris darwini TaxID=1538125 RepID=A0AAV4SXW0_9ARAC|nr:hypothetical protein CDAR_103981 [Caerostris darwini]
MPGSHTCYDEWPTDETIYGEQECRLPKGTNTLVIKNTNNKKRGWNVSLRPFINFKVVSFLRLFAAVGDAFNAFCDLASFPAWKDRPRPRGLLAPGSSGRHHHRG